MNRKIKWNEKKRHEMIARSLLKNFAMLLTVAIYIRMHVLLNCTHSERGERESCRCRARHCRRGCRRPRCCRHCLIRVRIEVESNRILYRINRHRRTPTSLHRLFPLVYELCSIFFFLIFRLFATHHTQSIYLFYRLNAK